jgi:aconitate hydratase
MSDTLHDPFGARALLAVGGRTFLIYRLDALARRSGVDLDRLPFSIKVLLEALLRNVGDGFTTVDDVIALAQWTPASAGAAQAAVQAGARPPAGLHRRAGRRRSGGDA